MKTCPNCGAQMADEAEYCGKCGAFLGLPPQQPSATPPGYPYPAGYPQVQFAGFWIRLVAVILDGIFLGIATIPIWIWVGISSFWTTNSSGAVEFHWNALRVFLLIVVSLVYMVYSIVMIGHYGATLGKMAMGIKVVKTDLSPVGYGWALVRETVGKWISGFICDLGYIWAGFDPRKQAWHDHLCNTLVIHK